MLGHLLFGQVENIVVIGTSQTLVTTDDNVANYKKIFEDATLALSDAKTAKEKADRGK